MEIGAWRAPCGSNWERKKQRRNLARKAEERCLTANLDGSSAKIISLVFRCEKAARCLGRKRSWGLWMHGDFQVFPSQCWEDVTMQIFYSFAFTVVQLHPELCYCRRGWSLSLPKNTSQFLQREILIHIVDYISKPTPVWAGFLSTSGIFSPNKVQQRNNKWWNWFDFQACSFFKIQR